MAIRLHLHIGTEKTGTTSFQFWLKQNETALEAAGIVRPRWEERFLPDLNHRMLAIYAMGFIPHDDGQRALMLESEEDHARLCAAFSEHLEAHVARRGGESWVFSSEHLHSRITRPEQVEKLAALLGRHFSEITIHLHVRPQADLARSLASTLARGGTPISAAMFEKITPQNPYYNYHQLAERWAQVFGAGNIRLIPYRRQPSMRRYFLDLWKLEEADFSPERRENRALDWRSLALLNTIAPHRRAVAALLPLYGALDGIPVETPLQIGPELAEAITARMRPSNARLVDNFGQVTMEDLTPAKGSHDAPANIDRLSPECDFAPHIAHVITHLQIQLELERVRTIAAQAQVLVEKGKPNRARKRLEEAAAKLLHIEPICAERPGFIRLQKHIAKKLLDL